MSRDHNRAGREAGFALILAILALMLLTFLGLTLAVTSSTELQIATNQRWSQQALYNAEAGLQAARIILSNAADPTTGLQPLLPPKRTAPSPNWLPGAAPPLGTNAGGYLSTATRDLENSGCDLKGASGYGRVLTDGTAAGGPPGATITGYENVSTFLGQTLNGAYTIWIRRELVSQADGTYTDSGDDNVAVVTVEGVAPFVATGGFESANQAVRVLEATLTLASSNTLTPCETMQGQVGLGSSGDNAQTCGPILQGGVILPAGGIVP